METFIDELSRKQKKVINFFLDNPTKEIHLRGLAKQIGISHTWTKKALEYFYEKKLISMKKKHDLEVKAERENELFKAIKRSRNLLKLDELSKHLNQIFRYPEAIVVFGSYAKGEDIEKSDIDIAIITKEKHKDIDLQKFEKKLEKKISLHIIKIPSKDFKTSLNNGIVLKGYLE